TGAAEDKEARALRESQVEALRIIEATETALAEDGERLLSAEERQALVSKIDDLKNILESDQAAAIQRLSDELNNLGREFAARRMDGKIHEALAGHSVEEFKD